MCNPVHIRCYTVKTPKKVQGYIFTHEKASNRLTNERSLFNHHTDIEKIMILRNNTGNWILTLMLRHFTLHPQGFLGNEMTGSL